MMDSGTPLRYGRNDGEFPSASRLIYEQAGAAAGSSSVV
jgi:hypothetical protein